MITLAQKKYRRTYHSPLFSIQHLFCFLIFILNFLLPIFLGSYQKYLWRYNFEVVSKPDLRYSDNFLLIVTRSDGSKKYYSSIEKYNNQIKQSTLISSLTYTRSILDENNDLNSDILKLNFLIEEENIISASLNLFIGYEFSESVFVNFTDVVSFDENLRSGMKSKVFGYFEVEQLQAYNNM